MAHIAEQRAHEQVAMARIKAGEVERQKILLSARENEAQQAQADAQQARNEAQNAQAQVAQAQSEAQRLAAQLENVQASQTSIAAWCSRSSDVLFDTGRARLKPGAAALASSRSPHSSTSTRSGSVQIEGFTDNQGPDDYNIELSQKRADAVAMAIIQRGIDAQRVRAMGYGEEFPVASNDNSGSRQLNRRVEIIVSNDDQAIPGRAGRGRAVKVPAGEFFPADFGGGLAPKERCRRAHGARLHCCHRASMIARCGSSAIRRPCRKCAT